MQETYFAASNSGAGFISYYPSLFVPARFGRLYLIKGGPGTGKSTLMRRAAARAEQEGLGVRCYACSSDPDSLDGVAVGGELFAMVDATAPHTQDPLLPGAADELIDLGQFWDSAILSVSRAEIAALNARKKAAYARAYHWLAAVRAVDQTTLALLEGCVDWAKLRGEVGRRLKYLRGGAGGETPALVSAVGMKGCVVLPTMHYAAERAFVLTETRGGGDLFLREVLAEVRARGAAAEVAHAPIDPAQTEGVHLPSEGIAFLDETVTAERRPQDKLINMSRFFRTVDLRTVRGELRMAAHNRRALLDGAAEAFSAAREAHFALEEIYSFAMDYRALEGFCGDLLDRIFAAVKR